MGWTMSVLIGGGGSDEKRRRIGTRGIAPAADASTRTTPLQIPPPTHTRALRPRVISASKAGVGSLKSNEFPSAYDAQYRVAAPGSIPPGLGKVTVTFVRRLHHERSIKGTLGVPEALTPKLLLEAEREPACFDPKSVPSLPDLRAMCLFTGINEREPKEGKYRFSGPPVITQAYPANAPKFVQESDYSRVEDSKRGDVYCVQAGDEKNKYRLGIAADYVAESMGFHVRKISTNKDYSLDNMVVWNDDDGETPVAHGPHTTVPYLAVRADVDAATGMIMSKADIRSYVVFRVEDLQQPERAPPASTGAQLRMDINIVAGSAIGSGAKELVKHVVQDFGINADGNPPDRSMRFVALESLNYVEASSAAECLEAGVAWSNPEAPRLDLDSMPFSLNRWYMGIGFVNAESCPDALTGDFKYRIAKEAGKYHQAADGGLMVYCYASNAANYLNHETNELRRLMAAVRMAGAAGAPDVAVRAANYDPVPELLQEFERLRERMTDAGDGWNDDVDIRNGMHSLAYRALATMTTANVARFPGDILVGLRVSMPIMSVYVKAPGEDVSKTPNPGNSAYAGLPDAPLYDNNVNAVSPAPLKNHAGLVTLFLPDGPEDMPELELPAELDPDDPENDSEMADPARWPDVFRNRNVMSLDTIEFRVKFDDYKQYNTVSARHLKSYAVAP